LLLDLNNVKKTYFVIYITFCDHTKFLLDLISKNSFFNHVSVCFGIFNNCIGIESREYISIHCSIQVNISSKIIETNKCVPDIKFGLNISNYRLDNSLININFINYVNDGTLFWFNGKDLFKYFNYAIDHIEKILPNYKLQKITVNNLVEDFGVGDAYADNYYIARKCHAITKPAKK